MGQRDLLVFQVFCREEGLDLSALVHVLPSAIVFLSLPLDCAALQVGDGGHDAGRAHLHRIGAREFQHPCAGMMAMRSDDMA